MPATKTKIVVIIPPLFVDDRGNDRGESVGKHLGGDRYEMDGATFADLLDDAHGCDWSGVPHMKPVERAAKATLRNCHRAAKGQPEFADLLKRFPLPKPVRKVGA